MARRQSPRRHQAAYPRMIDVVANDEAAHLGDAARAADPKGKRGRERKRLVILVNTDFVDFVAVRPACTAIEEVGPNRFLKQVVCGHFFNHPPRQLTVIQTRLILQRFQAVTKIVVDIDIEGLFRSFRTSRRCHGGIASRGYR